jgi:hypothetical protein
MGRPFFFYITVRVPFVCWLTGDVKDVAASQQTDVRPKQDKRREVTYEVFAHEIWPKIIKKSQVGH